jgi:hypothetical protein
MAEQIHAAVEEFPVISTMDELWDLPEESLLLAHGQVWERRAYLLAQGFSSARGGKLHTGTAIVLWVP